jgi:hypothetical protein
MGSVKAATAPVVYSVGHARDPVVSYITAGTCALDRVEVRAEPRDTGDKMQARRSYFWSKYSSVSSLVRSWPV